MKVSFTDIASQEYLDVVKFYNLKRDGLGYEFVIEVDNCIRNILSYPLAWQKVSKRVRRILVRRFQYGIIYSYSDDAILILSVMNLHRKPDSWKIIIEEIFNDTTNRGKWSIRSGLSETV